MQGRLDLQKMVYFTYPAGQPCILAVSKTDECQVFGFKGASKFKNREWVGCQVGQNRLFQAFARKDRFRILKMDPTQRCFSIEREGDQPIRSQYYPSLANFKDKFVFRFSNKDSNRYSLAEDKWEKLPTIGHLLLSACSLGDKVYVLSLISRIIKVLHNPDAPVSSQEMHWQEIEGLRDFLLPCYSPAFPPLNSTEIVIAGGWDKNGKTVGDIITFDTTTCEFKK